MSTKITVDTLTVLTEIDASTYWFAVAIPHRKERDLKKEKFLFITSLKKSHNSI